MFEARYSGFCDDCGEPFGKGTAIKVDPTSGGALTYVHEVCPGSSRSKKTAVVCTVCFIEKPCGCEDGQ